jgi:putative ABC transport system substrate-binding protein
MSAMMKRRDFIPLLGGAAVWPLAARAQQNDRMRRVGLLMGYPEGDLQARANVVAFREGLTSLGWIARKGMPLAGRKRSNEARTDSFPLADYITSLSCAVARQVRCRVSQKQLLR